MEKLLRLRRMTASRGYIRRANTSTTPLVATLKRVNMQLVGWHIYRALLPIRFLNIYTLNGNNERFKCNTEQCIQLRNIFSRGVAARQSRTDV